MKHHLLVLAVTLFAFLNGCDLTESYWYLARESPLPKGLQSDAQATRVAASASHIELWIYTYHPPVLRFCDGADEVLKREASGYRRASPSEGDALFFVQFNGVESKFRHVTSSNVVEVADDPATTPAVTDVKGARPSIPPTTRAAAPPKGTVICADQEQAIIAIETLSGRTRTVRLAPVQSPNGRPGIWAVAGPDTTGLVAFVEEYFPTPSHALKVVQLDGSAERTVFERAGDAIWKRAIGKHLAISPSGGRVALVGQMHGAQMPMALLEEGPLELWDIARKTNTTCGQIIDEGIAWLPDGHHLVCVRLLPRNRVPPMATLDDGFGKLEARWDRVPAICIVNVDTGEERCICQGVEPVVSSDGAELLVTDFATDAGTPWRQIQISTGNATAVPFSSDRSYLAFDASGSSLYLALPPPGEPVGKTKYYSPLHGPSNLLSLRRGLVDEPVEAGIRIADGFDPRNIASFGRPALAIGCAGPSTRPTTRAAAPSEGH